MGCLFAIGVGLPVKLWSGEIAQSIDPSVVASRIPRAETGSKSDHMTGDWAGVRTRMVESGFHFSSGYSGEIFGNISGGKKRGVEYEGLFELGLDVDPSKFSSWQESAFHVSSLYPHGASPSGQLVGDLSTISNIDAYDSTLLFEWWMEQNFWEQRFSIRIGQLAADEEFAIVDFAEGMLNADFGWPSFISLNAPAPAFPVAALGVRLRWSLPDYFYIQGGVYDGNPDPGDASGGAINQHGTRIKLSEDEGAFTMAEFGYDSIGDPSADGLRGSYKLGAWCHTGDFSHLREDQSGLALSNSMSSGMPKELDGNWGVYTVVNQMLWREETDSNALGQGLGIFFRAGGSPSDRSLIELDIDAGFQYKGLFPGRDADVAGFGVAWLNLSDESGKLAQELGAEKLDYEVALEATYQIMIQPWWLIQPDIQYIIHPGGSAELNNALVIGMRSSLIF